MRRHLFLAFLGLWIAIFPFLPISPGSTEKAALGLAGLIIIILSLLSLRDSSPHT